MTFFVRSDHQALYREFAKWARNLYACSRFLPSVLLKVGVESVLGGAVWWAGPGHARPIPKELPVCNYDILLGNMNLAAVWPVKKICTLDIVISAAAN